MPNHIENEKGASSFPQSAEIFDRLKEYQSKLEQLKWEGTFAEYLPKVVENPALTRTAHAYLYDAIVSAPDLFERGENALYGAEKPIGEFMESLEAAAEDGETGKVIFLFLGPPGSGKSTFVRVLKHRLEEYSLTPEGATYAIADCPMHEDPMNLIPVELRKQFERQTGVHIEGTLCPHCHAKYAGSPENAKDVPVKRIFLSESDRTGITTIKPADSKSQNYEDFVGSENLAKLAEIGDSTSPFVYELNGEIERGNRGIIELVEFFQLNKEFRKLFLDLVHDHMVKAPRFPEFYSRSVFLAHTNQGEYDDWLEESGTAGLKDRIKVIPWGYNLRIKEEGKIHDKLIRESGLGRKARQAERPHLIAPYTLQAAATFGVLSRLIESSRGRSKMAKLQVYDGQYVEGISKDELLELQKEGEDKREGMTGISPRYIIRALEQGLIRVRKENPDACLTPIEALKALQNGLDNHPDTRDMDKKQKDAIRGLIAEAGAAYNDWAKVKVQEAFVPAFKKHAEALFEKYIHLLDRLYGSKTREYDPLTEKEIPVDKEFMSMLELQAGIAQSGQDEFRRQVFFQLAAFSLRNEPFTYASYKPLRDAIEKQITAKMSDIIEGTLSSPTPDAEQQKRLGEVEASLIKEVGCCPYCARDLIKHTTKLFGKKR